jgi:predicted enzyme related to lactoylglutathione lyase
VACLRCESSLARLVVHTDHRSDAGCVRTERVQHEDAEAKHNRGESDERCHSLCDQVVSNMDEAVRFHVVHLGLELRFQSPEWSEFETGGTTLALHKSSAEHPAGTCQLGFRVAEVDEFYSNVTAQGVEAVAPPVDLHGQRIAKLRDTDGAEFSVSGGSVG